MKGLNHVAGSYRGKRQKCSRCGITLIDNKKVAASTDGVKGYPRGTKIYIEGSFTGAMRNPDAKNCRKPKEKK